MPLTRPPLGSKLSHTTAATLTDRVGGMMGMVGDGVIVGEVSGNGMMSLRIDMDVLRSRLGQFYHDDLVIINSSTPHGGVFQWEYTCQFVVKVLAGPGVTSWNGYGDEITAFNLAENINNDTTGSNPFGNGVKKDDLEAVGTFVLPPIPDKSIVTIRPVVVNRENPSLNEVEFWITGMGVPNGVTGDCP